MDRLALGVEPLPSEFGGGASVRVVVNGRDLLEMRGSYDPGEPQGVANHSIVPMRAKSFPRGLFYGDAGYWSSPFDDRVPLLEGYICPPCCDLLARVVVHDERVDWTNFGRPDTGTRGWRPSALGDYFGAYVFKRSQYEEALDEAASEFARAIPARDFDLSARVDAVVAILGALPDSVLIQPPDAGELPSVDRSDREELRAIVVPHARAIVRAATTAIAEGRLELGRQDLECVQIWRWNLARATARLEEAL